MEIAVTAARERRQPQPGEGQGVVDDDQQDQDGDGAEKIDIGDGQPAPAAAARTAAPAPAPARARSPITMLVTPSRSVVESPLRISGSVSMKTRPLRNVSKMFMGPVAVLVAERSGVGR